MVKKSLGHLWPPGMKYRRMHLFWRRIPCGSRDPQKDPRACPKRSAALVRASGSGRASYPGLLQDRFFGKDRLAAQACRIHHRRLGIQPDDLPRRGDMGAGCGSRFRCPVVVDRNGLRSHRTGAGLRPPNRFVHQSAVCPRGEDAAVRLPSAK